MHLSTYLYLKFLYCSLQPNSNSLQGLGNSFQVHIIIRMHPLRLNKYLFVLCPPSRITETICRWFLLFRLDARQNSLEFVTYILN